MRARVAALFLIVLTILAAAALLVGTRGPNPRPAPGPGTGGGGGAGGGTGGGGNLTSLLPNPRGAMGLLGPISRPSGEFRGYGLPLSPSSLSNPEALDSLGLDQRARGVLLSDGFVYVGAGYWDDFSEAYESLEHGGAPVYVTVDSVLHTYHVLFDWVLADLEEDRLAPDLAALSRAMLDRSSEQASSLDGDLAEAARRNEAFFSVALSLLDPSFSPPPEVADVVSAELELIRGHAGFASSPLFGYREDYSQYVPRGHYTRSETLERYFRAMMWYGRMAFFLNEGLVSGEEARMLTLQAALISSSLPQVRLPDGRTAGQVWSSIYAVTSFFVEAADDLTPYQYLRAMEEVLGVPDPSGLLDPSGLEALRERLRQERPPLIYSGSGLCNASQAPSAEELRRCLEQTAGMRFMGQRAVPDSVIFQRLVFPSVGLYRGSGEPFTLVHSQLGPIRGFPRGLDVMAALGSGEALEILREEGDANYSGYEEALASLAANLSSLDERDWSRSLYWGWLSVLRELVRERGPAYPEYMRTRWWERRQLQAALASWAELRHDTILYAKQSYTMVATAAPPPPAGGYVEPLPAVFERLAGLTRMTREGLRGLGYLTEEAEWRLSELEGLLEELARAARDELAGRPLTGDAAYLVQSISDRLDSITANMSDRTRSTVVVADVHTDTNTGQVLEEGVGRIDLIVVVFPDPERGPTVCVGPVLTYYEFKHPASDRLTDEAWASMLEAEPPGRALWQESLYGSGGG